MKLNEKIFELRKKNGWSQEELADKLDVSRQTVSKWESDKVNPELSKLIALADIFNISVDELLGREVTNAEIENAINDTLKNNKGSFRSNIKKVLIVLLIIICIYLVYVLYKFISLSIMFNIAKSFSEENYRIFKDCYMVNVYDEKTTIDIHEEKNGDYYIQKMYVKQNNDKEDNFYNYPLGIYVYDLKKKIAYSLSYQYDTKKYYYEDITKDVFESENTERILEDVKLGPGKQTTTTIGETLLQRFVISINPEYTVSLIGKKITFRDWITNDTNYFIVLNNDYLVMNTSYQSNMNGKSYTQISYDYVPGHFDESNITNPLEEYKDIVEYP